MNTKVNFYLKRKVSREPTAIYAQTYIGGKPFKFYVGKSIYPQLWDFENQSAIDDLSLIKEWEKRHYQISIELRNINTRCRKVANLILNRINLDEAMGNLTDFKELRLYLNEELGLSVESPKKIPKKLLDFLDQFINEIQTGKRLTSKKELFKKGTIKNYLGFRVQLNEYQDSRHKLLRFEDITMDFYDDFVQFFLEKKYSPNTIGRQIKHLKVIMGAAMDLGLHKNVEFQRKKFKTIDCEVDSIYMTSDELRRILELDLSTNAKLEEARDVWIMGAFLGLRYSDYSRLSPEHFRINSDGNLVVDIFTRKSSERAIIPVHGALEEILERRNYAMPKTIEQVLNRQIKEVARMAGIVDDVGIQSVRGGQKVHVRKQKCELVTTHTARRSALTNMYLSGIPTIDIMKISGHRTEKNFLKYLKVSKEETAGKLANHSHFKSHIRPLSKVH